MGILAQSIAWRAEKPPFGRSGPLYILASQKAAPIWCLLLWVLGLGPIVAAASPGLLSEQYMDDPVFGGKVYVQSKIIANKPVVVLVHGIGDNGARDWRHAIAALTDRYSVLAFDLPGFGRSDKGNKDYTPDRYVDLVRSLTQRLVSRPFYLVGHSLGGAIALRYAARHPKDVEKLVVVDAAGILHRTAYTQFLSKLGIDLIPGAPSGVKGRLYRFTGDVIERIEQRFQINPTFVTKYPFTRSRLLQGRPAAIAGFNLVHTDFNRTLDKVQSPTLILWGRDDDIAPLRTATVLEVRLKRTRLLTFTGVKHVPMLEAPHLFNRTLLNFLASPEIMEPSPAWGVGQVQHSTSQRVGRCNGQANQLFEGVYDRLEIRNCKNVRVRNTKLRTLSAIGSSIAIDHSTISADKTAISAVNSRVVATATTITGDTAIDTSNSHFDLAAVRLSGRTSALTSGKTSTVVFSLSRIDSPANPNRYMHAFHKLTPGSSL